MRRSVDNMQGTTWDVWLDGVLQKDVVMADDETGEVERFKRDEDESLLIAGDSLVTETVRGKVEIRRSGSKGMLKPAKAEGLVAPNWSDSGDVPVGEVTELKADQNSLDSMVRMWVREEIAGPVARHIGFRFKDWSDVQPKPAKPSDPNAKPAMPALSRIAGEAYRGLGWCDE